MDLSYFIRLPLQVTSTELLLCERDHIKLLRESILCIWFTQLRFSLRQSIPHTLCGDSSNIKLVTSCNSDAGMTVYEGQPVCPGTLPQRPVFPGRAMPNSSHASWKLAQHTSYGCSTFSHLTPYLAASVIASLHPSSLPNMLKSRVGVNTAISPF